MVFWGRVRQFFGSIAERRKHRIAEVALPRLLPPAATNLEAVK